MSLGPIDSSVLSRNKTEVSLSENLGGPEAGEGLKAAAPMGKLSGSSIRGCLLPFR